MDYKDNLYLSQRCRPIETMGGIFYKTKYQKSGCRYPRGPFLKKRRPFFMPKIRNGGIRMAGTKSAAEPDIVTEKAQTVEIF